MNTHRDFCGWFILSKHFISFNFFNFQKLVKCFKCYDYSTLQIQKPFIPYIEAENTHCKYHAKPILIHFESKLSVNIILRQIFQVSHKIILNPFQV